MVPADRRHNSGFLPTSPPSQTDLGLYLAGVRGFAYCFKRAPDANPAPLAALAGRKQKAPCTFTSCLHVCRVAAATLHLSPFQRRPYIHARRPTEFVIRVCYRNRGLPTSVGDHLRPSLL